MGTPITNLEFKLYRNDIEDGYNKGEIQKEIFNTEQADLQEGNVYTFSKVFEAAADSSFGLDENSFRVGIYAKDMANDPVILTLENLEDHIATDASINDFGMKVRVKEQTVPYVAPDTSAWGNYCNTNEFTATFIAYDQNNNNRLAGINSDKNSMIITLTNKTTGEKTVQTSDLLNVASISNEGYPTFGLDNGEVYKITYPFVLEEGEYTIGLQVHDNDENISVIAERDIIIKTSVPSITLNNPENNQIYGYGQSIEVKGSINVPSKVYVTIFKKGEDGNYTEKVIDNELIHTTNSVNESFSKNYTNNLEDGYYKIIVKAVDVNYESSYSEEIREFVKDTLAPRFLSVKFYPVNKENNTITGEATKELLSGHTYKIVVVVE